MKYHRESSHLSGVTRDSIKRVLNSGLRACGTGLSEDWSVRAVGDATLRADGTATDGRRFTASLELICTADLSSISLVADLRLEDEVPYVTVPEEFQPAVEAFAAYLDRMSDRTAAEYWSRHTLKPLLQLQQDSAAGRGIDFTLARSYLRDAADRLRRHRAPTADENRDTDQVRRLLQRADAAFKALGVSLK